MILSTTSAIEGRPAARYLGIVSGQAIMGTNVFKDLFASVRDIVGGRSAAYEDETMRARETALGELEQRAKSLGADAVVGIHLDTEVIGGDRRTLMMVTAVGTAVKLG